LFLVHLRAMLAPVIVAAVTLGSGAPCRADLVISAPNLTVDPGSSGSFDVLITSNGGTFYVAADDIELTLSGLSTVSFTNISINTATPYIYGSSSATLFGSPFIVNLSPNDVEGVDYLFTSGAQTINAGDTFGLMNVQYTVASNAVAGTSGTLGIGPDTLLSDATGLTVAVTPQAGSITIGVASVPEPSTVILLLIGCGAVLVGSARSRRVRSNP
jgi:PEP-CTERM motif